MDVVDYTLELTFHSSSDLFSVTELTIWLRKETNYILNNHTKLNGLRFSVYCLLHLHGVCIRYALYI